MGFESGGGQKTYLKISNGKIAVRCEENDPGAIRCTNKDGSKTWFEKHYPGFSGMITGVSIREQEWGGKKIKDLCIDIEDEGEAYQLQMLLDSKYAAGFLKCMPNIDVTRKVTFNPWMKEVAENGKVSKKTALYLQYSKEEKIEWAWTRENPGDMPDLKKTVFKGEDVWDNTDQMNFLVTYMATQFAPKLAGSQPYRSEVEPNDFTKPVKDQKFIDEMNASVDEDDLNSLPF